MATHTRTYTSCAMRYGIAIVLIINILSCKKKTQTYIVPDAEFSAYVNAYTSGEISKTGAVMVRFNDAAVSSNRVGTPLSNGVFRLTPNVAGTAEWEDERTIKFAPSDDFKSGENYVVGVRLDKIFDKVPGELKDFEFNFRTREQHLRVNFEGIRAPDPSDLSQQEISGTIITADIADADAVKQILSVKQKNNDQLDIEWSHSVDQTNHAFTVKNIARTDRESAVKFNWDGEAIGTRERGNRSIKVPSIADFSVVDVVSNKSANQGVKITFSDPLKSDQDLDGLVLIENYDKDIRYVIDGSTLRIFPKTKLSGEQKITIARAVKNSEGKRMKNPGEWTITFEQQKPQVRLLGRGVIVPDSEGLMFPFEAVSLNAVDVEIFKIFSNNTLQFLQNNRISGDYNLRQVGRVVYQKKVALSSLKTDPALGSWNRYALDLSKFINRDPDAIYQVRIGFKQAYATYECKDDNSENTTTQLTEMGEEKALTDDDDIKSIMQYRYRWDYDGYKWEHRQKPCYPPYYNPEHFVSRNVIPSNFGLIAKRGTNGDVYVIVTNLLTAKPESGVNVELFDYQQQMVGKVKTNDEGIAILNSKREVFAVIANKGKEHGYLKLGDGMSLSMSRFDVAGDRVQKGLKGYVYGERGVWRPGDSIYLSFILEDKEKTLPSKHPVTFEFYDPKGQLQQRNTTSEHTEHIYSFSTKTDPDARTGNWRAKIQIGGATFTKTIKVETIKPNRLKINVDFGKDELSATDGKELKGKLQVNWLHGAPAKNLKTIVEADVSSTNTTFQKFPEFEFDDPARRLKSEPQVIFEEKLDKDGAADISASIESKEAPGKLKANFKTRAFEEGGDFSVDNFTVDYSPYPYYAGIRIPLNRYGSKRLDMKETHNLDVVLLDKDGKPAKNRELSVGFYKLEWRWWWSRSRGNLTSFNSSSHRGALSMDTIQTNREGIASVKVKPENWGRYLVRVCDADGHCTGDIFYAGTPWYDNDDEMDEEARRAASMLAFSTDKEKYEVGDAIEVRIPTSEDGRILLSIENGSKVLETHWVNTKKGETKYKFYATEKMVPTAYLNVSHIQPHGQAKNDLPIRMYGVIPVSVEDPATRLQPEVDMPEVLKPEETFTVKVSEKDGKPMAYTLAIVDDGLLDLTRFKTPDAWSAFYAREALGVATWDVYDNVLGAFGGDLERILSIGGDGAAAVPGAQRANRFKPVVRHIGPFYLNKRKTNTHEIVMPNYVGSVRAMVIAAKDGAYGKSEVTTPVRKPLMVLATLPRVLSPTETLTLPVNVFAMEDKVRDVKIRVESNGLLEFPDGDTQRLTFTKPGDEVVYFNVKVPEKIGVAKVKIIAEGGGEITTQEIELDVRNPNPYVTDVLEEVVAEGGTWQTKLKPVGMYGTNSAMLEVSNLPPINLGKRLRYLIRYPHGCIEQTTSSVFPQLYVSRLMDLEEERKKEIDTNVKAGLERLKKFQVASGGFAYWPGGGEASDWGSNYAGHFMLEAQKLGYSLPVGMLDKWKKHQKREARNWTPPAHKKGFTDHGSYNSYDLMQAYRLYTLALAGAPELGSMNRMRESTNLTPQGAWQLAAAYAAAGKSEVSKALIAELPTDIAPYRELARTYGSDLRDQGMILETLVMMDDKSKAANLLKAMSDKLASGRWYSTQTTAYCLLAIGKLVTKSGGNAQQIRLTYNVGDKGEQNAGSTNPVLQIPIDIDRLDKQELSLTNQSGGVLYARVLIDGKPLQGDSTNTENDLKMSIRYQTLKGKKLDPTSIEQGTDFVAMVTLTNPGKRGNYEEMALTQVFPAGWELRNLRMDNIDYNLTNDNAEYQDIRDDRIYTYFDIGSSSTRTYSILLNAAYEGRYYLPSVYCEAMYDNAINAREKGGWVEVVRGDS